MDQTHLFLSYAHRDQSMAVALERALKSSGMRDLSRPPFHRLPREELLDRLRALTNYRVVDDPDDPGQFELILEPFSSWQTAPEWW